MAKKAKIIDGWSTLHFVCGFFLAAGMYYFLPYLNIILDLDMLAFVAMILLALFELIEPFCKPLFRASGIEGMDNQIMDIVIGEGGVLLFVGLIQWGWIV